MGPAPVKIVFVALQHEGDFLLRDSVQTPEE